MLLQKAKINDFLAYLAIKQIEVESAFILAEESIDIKTKLKDTFNLSIPYRILGQLYKSQKNYDKSRDMYKTASELSRKYKNTYNELMSEIELAKYGSGKLLLDGYDEKEQTIYINRLEIIANKANESKQLRVAAQAYFYICQAYGRIKNIEKNYEYALKSRSLYELESDVIGLEKVNFSLGSYFRKRGEPKKSISFFKKSIEIKEKLEDSVKLKFRYLGLSNAYQQSGNYKGAYEYYLKYKTIDKRLTSIEKVRELAEVEARLIYDKQKALDSLRYKNEETLKTERLKEKNNQRFTYTVLAAGTLIALMIIGYLLFRQRVLKAENQLMIKNERNRELQDIIKEKTHEVSSLVSETVEFINKKEKLAQNLKLLALKKEGISIQSILTELKADKIEDDKSILLKSNIAEISSEFKSKLIRNYPKLTKNDLEISSFIRLGLTQKEISNLRNTSIGAVKKSRYRLKNKLELNKEQALDDFLKNL